jgi:membrane-associated phospholipid phosphatase
LTIEPNPKSLAAWKVLWMVGVVGGLYSLYLLLNHHPVWEPRLLPMLAVDRWMPMLPWTVWPYLLLSNIIAAPVLLRDPRLFLRCLNAMIIGYSINLLVFLFYPTTYPRDFDPLNAGVSQLGFELLYGVDSPGNCCPSGHITAPLIVVWALAKDYPKARLWLWGAFLLMCPTILTTKQHYFVDLLGGAFTGWLGLILADRFPFLMRFLPKQT